MFVCMFIILYVYMLDISQLVGCFSVSPQAPVINLPATSVPVECVPAGTNATGEMEVQVAHHYW